MSCAVPERAGTFRSRKGYQPNTLLGGFMRSVLLWAIGIPLPIILILWLVTGHA